MNLAHLLTFSQRGKHLLVIGATLLPIASFMLLSFLTAFRPVFSSMDNMIYEALHEMHPVHELQIALLKSVMPPNDYLIHGSDQEKHNWAILTAEVDEALEASIQAVRFGSERSSLLAVREKWGDARKQGDLLLQDQINRPEAAVAMERFDADVDYLTLQLGRLVKEMEKEIQQEYKQVLSLKKRSIVYAVTSILLGLLVGVLGSIWFTRDRSRIISQSMLDPLTGCYNRRALTNELATMQKSVQADLFSCFSLIMMDIDRFKLINDQFGHDVGDLALKQLADITRGQVRNSDIFGRYGGEEFLLLLPATSKDMASRLAERIRQAVASQPIDLGAEPTKCITMTVSMGVVTVPDDSPDADEAIKCADKAMYRAKESGRNKVVCV